MKKSYKLSVFMAAMVCLAAAAQAGSYYAAHETLAALNIGPGVVRSVEFVAAFTTNAGAYVELQAGEPAVYRVTAAQAEAATNVTVNVTDGLSGSDTVLIVHADGTVDYRTVAGTADSLLTLTEVPSAALATGTRIWKLAAAGRYYLPFTYQGSNTETKVSLPLVLRGPIYKAYGVPMRLELSGGDAVLSVTTAE